MTAWLGPELTPADFDVTRAPRGTAKRAKRDAEAARNGETALFTLATPDLGAKPAPAPARLPGEVDLFADVAESPGHVPDPDPEHGAYDVCQHCRAPIVQHWERRDTWVTMTGGSAECCGRK